MIREKSARGWRPRGGGEVSLGSRRWRWFRDRDSFDRAQSRVRQDHTGGRDYDDMDESAEGACILGISRLMTVVDTEEDAQEEENREGGPCPS